MLTAEQLQAVKDTLQNTNILTDEAKNMLFHVLESGEELSEDFIEAVSLVLDIEDVMIQKKVYMLENEMADIGQEQLRVEKEYQEKENEIRQKLPLLMEEEAEQAIEEIRNIYMQYDAKAEEMVGSVEKSQEEVIRNSLLQK